jgi:hypothetical protein
LRPSMAMAHCRRSAAQACPSQEVRKSRCKMSCSSKAMHLMHAVSMQACTCIQQASSWQTIHHMMLPGTPSFQRHEGCKHPLAAFWLSNKHRLLVVCKGSRFTANLSSTLLVAVPAPHADAL